MIDHSPIFESFDNIYEKEIYQIFEVVLDASAGIDGGKKEREKKKRKRIEKEYMEAIKEDNIQS